MTSAALEALAARCINAQKDAEAHEPGSDTAALAAVYDVLRAALLPVTETAAFQFVRHVCIEPDCTRETQGRGVRCAYCAARLTAATRKPRGPSVGPRHNWRRRATDVDGGPGGGGRRAADRAPDAGPTSAKTDPER